MVPVGALHVGSVHVPVVGHWHAGAAPTSSTEETYVSNELSAETVEYQLANAWPPDETLGVVTIKGRTPTAVWTVPAISREFGRRPRRGGRLIPWRP